MIHKSILHFIIFISAVFGGFISFVLIFSLSHHFHNLFLAMHVYMQL